MKNPTIEGKLLEPARATLPTNCTEEHLHRRDDFVVILANTWRQETDFPAPLARVASLPVALRAILGAQKSGARQILVVTNPQTGPEVRRTLTASRRLPPSVEWLEINDAEFSFPRLAAMLAERSTGRLILISADTVYHPSTHQTASRWRNGTDALVMVDDQQLVGIQALSSEGAKKLSMQNPAQIRTSAELSAWLSASCRIHYETVPNEDWHPVHNSHDVVEAERKIDRWLVKSTDGIFARMNRRISIPISHQLIKTSVTPNMISVFTLGVGLLSGFCFATAGYRCTLLGALLSVFASILDGCDGEVARLTFQESAFGCWLETVCDYLYYLIIFGGIAAGLIRHSTGYTVPLIAVLLLVGVVLSMLVTSYQRYKLTDEKPEKYLATWQARVEKQNNFFLWLGRHTEFMIRRCFLPYALLAFALFNATRVAFVLCAVGSNIVWPIALYSNYRLSSHNRTPNNSKDTCGEEEQETRPLEKCPELEIIRR